MGVAFAGKGKDSNLIPKNVLARTKILGNKCKNTSKVNLKSYFKDHQNYTDLSHFIALSSFD